MSTRLKQNLPEGQNDQWLEGESPLDNLMGVKCKQLVRALAVRRSLKEAIAKMRLDEQKSDKKAVLARRYA